MTPSERFWAKVDKSDDCWVWTASVDQCGYGRVMLRALLGTGNPQLAHRVSWMFEYGEMPPSHLLVLHRCDNPPCVRPQHLFLGTHADNTSDMMQKGRRRGGVSSWSNRTHGTRNGMARMTEESVVELRERFLSGELVRALAPDYGIAVSTAGAIAYGATWRHVWPYSEGNPRKRRSA